MKILLAAFKELQINFETNMTACTELFYNY